jgi:hypothetical protein
MCLHEKYGEMLPKADLLIMEYLKCTTYIMEIIYYIVKYIFVHFYIDIHIMDNIKSIMCNGDDNHTIKLCTSSNGDGSHITKSYIL